MSETLAMMTAITEQTRSASKSARGLNSIFSRYSQILDEESSTGKKLIEIFEGLNIALFDQEGQIRSTYDILSDLAGKWQGLSKNEQEYIALTSAGANQLNNFLALMNGFNTALDANKVALNSAGSAVQENEKYMDSLAAKVSQFKSAWEALSNSVVNSDLVKVIINLGTGALKALNTDIGTTITQFTLLTGAFTGAVSIGSKFIANLLPGLKGVATAMAGISAAALPIAAAIAGITTVAIAGYSAWQDYKEVVYGAVDAYNELTAETKKTFAETNSSIDATTERATELVDKLDELTSAYKDLESQGKDTESIQQEYTLTVERLNDLMPELGLSIDDNTGLLNTQTGAIREQIKQWEIFSKSQAFAQAKQSSTTAQINLEAEIRTKKKDLEDLKDQQQAIVDEYGGRISEASSNDKWTGKLANRVKEGLSYFGITSQGEERKASEEYWDLQDRINNLTKSIDVSKEALKDAQKVYDSYEELEKEYRDSLSADESDYYSQQKSGKGQDSATDQKKARKPQFDYSSWLKEQQHALNTGKIQEADYYASLQAMLDKYTEESIISTDERWKAEEAIYKYQKNLSKEQQTAYEKKVKEQQQAAENAAKAAQQEAQAQTTAYKQAFADWLDEKEYLLNTDQITEQEYYDALKAKNEEYYGGKSEYLSEYRKYAEIVYKWEKKQNDEIAKAAKQAHEDEFDSWLAKMEHALAMGEISEEDYYERLKEMSDEYFKGDEEYLEKYWKYEEQYYSWKQKQIEIAAEAEKKAQEEALERQKEKLKLQQQELQTEQDNLNAVISYAQKYSQKQIDDIDERINKLKDEANAIKDNYQDQIDKLKETNEALDDQIEKQKLLEALAKAQQTKKYVFKDGRFQYVDDVDAITSAQEALDNYNRQQSLNERVALLEKQRDAELASNEAAQAALEQQKQRWQDYKDGWANLTDEYEYNQNELLALEQYGIDFEKATWDERIANLNDFKERYAQNVKDLEKLAARLNSLETSGSSSGTIQTATKVDPDQAILDEMKANSQAWWFASTDKEREAIHKRNVELNEMLSKKGTYDSGSGKWSHYAKGTTSARGGLSLVGEKGAELRVLNKGDGVVPARMTENLMDWGTQKPNDFVNKMLNKGKEVLSNVINVGNVSLPNVQNAKEFVSELKNLAYQAAYSRT